MDNHTKNAIRIAKQLAKGGYSKGGKKKLVSRWAQEMKAMLKGKQ